MPTRSRAQRRRDTEHRRTHDIDEYEFVVHPRLAGHGPTLFAGLSKHVDLKLVSRLEFGSGAVAMRYEPRR
jgi:dihydrofolate reductase